MRKGNRIHDLAQIALMSAIFCVLAPIAMPVPFSPVPITFGTLVLYLTGTVLGAKKGAASVGIYLLIGLAGLPVFSGFTAGFTKLMGPGGGYMLGYLPAVICIGWLTKRETEGRGLRQNLKMAGIFVCGALLCYSFGTAWFLVVMDGTYTFLQAILICVVPFLPFEFVKIVLACIISLPIKRKLRRAGIMSTEEYM
ncbi:MAG: biotin transporter BioY [Lachnospiraceae bacterium]|nr:biotin transporter BioY [Lachnospiraceae bacterium]